MSVPNENRLNLARLAGQYGLKTAQGCEAARRAGVNIRRGAALVAPWQERRLRPELAAMQQAKESKEKRHRQLIEELEYLDRFKYDSEESARLGFTNRDWQEQLRKFRRKLGEEEEGETA